MDGGRTFAELFPRILEASGFPDSEESVPRDGRTACGTGADCGGKAVG